MESNVIRVNLHDKHVANIERKYETLRVKEAILTMWEERDDYDPGYVVELRRKIRNLKVQILAMAPGTVEK